MYMWFLWLLVVLVAYRWFLHGYSIKQLFGVPVYSVMLGADIGGHKRGYKIRKKGIMGAPDALFFDPLSWCLVVGEFKSRSLKNRALRPSLRETYQVQLYMGLVRSVLCPRVTSIICYGCRRRIKIEFDKTIFKGLLDLRQEVKQAREIWVAPDTRPLHCR